MSIASRVLFDFDQGALYPQLCQVLKFSDNKANTARRGMICISFIPSECPWYSYNGTVALKMKLNNQSSANNP